MKVSACVFLVLVYAGLRSHVLGGVPIGRETCVGAESIPGLPFSASFDNSTATGDGPLGSCNETGATAMQNDIWFEYVATAACVLRIQVDPRGYHGIVAVYEGLSCPIQAEIGCADAAGPILLDIPAAAGNIYRIQIGAKGRTPSGGSTGFALSCRPAFVAMDRFTKCVAQWDLVDPAGTETLTLRGSGETHVRFEGDQPGDAVDDDRNDLDEVQTEIVSLSLGGSSSRGPVEVRLHSDSRSLGLVEERVNNNPGRLDVDPVAPGTADAFFDVFFEVEVNGQVLVTDGPVRLSGAFSMLPAAHGDVLSSTQRVQLLDAATGQPSGLEFGPMTKEVNPAPEVQVDVFEKVVGQLLLDRWEQGVLARDAVLPRTDGEHRSGRAEYNDAAVQVVLTGLRRRVSDTPPPRATLRNEDEHLIYHSEVTAHAHITGISPEPMDVELRLTGPTEVVVRNKEIATTGSWETEIISMDLSGQVPGGPTVTLRKNPAQSSLGRASVEDIGGGQFRIDSFFDVFTELSVDGGNFIPGDAYRERLVQPGVNGPPGEVDRPDMGAFQVIRPVEYDANDLKVQLDKAHFRALRYPAPIVNRVGNDVEESYQGALTGRATLTSPQFGQVEVPVRLTGPVQTLVQDKGGSDTGFWQTEILSMDLTGNVVLPGQPPIQVHLRNDPGHASTGESAVTDLGGGTFHVDSFFDIFTELSVDGGQNFNTASDLMRAELAPAPELVVLTGPATKQTTFEREEGQAEDDDRNGLDEVVTEMVSLDLVGISPVFGPVGMGIRRDERSTGQIEERNNDTPGTLDVSPYTEEGVADSFFDVWTEISVAGRALVTGRPLRKEGAVGSVPVASGERISTRVPVCEELNEASSGLGTGVRVVRSMLQPAPTIEFDHFELTTAFVSLQGGPLGPSPVPFTLTGPTDVQVYFEGPNEGAARDDDGDGLEEVASELVSMSLTDGNVILRIRNTPGSSPSLGLIEERANRTPGVLDVDPFAPGDADSFFDVFFEVELADGTVLHNRAPLRLAAVIHEKPPPGACFEGAFPEGPIELYDENNQPTGVFLTAAKHATGFVEIDQFTGMVGQLLIEAPPPQGVRAADPVLPRAEGEHRSASAVYNGPDFQVELTNIRRGVADQPPPRASIIGQDEVLRFDSTFTANAVITGHGASTIDTELHLVGPTKVNLRGKGNGTTGSWQTEMVSLDLTGSVAGGPTIVIRQDPARASSGGASVEDLGGGQFRIDSFFDVYTELSVDGGAFQPVEGAVRERLVQPGVRGEAGNVDLPGGGVLRGSRPLVYESRNVNVRVELPRLRCLKFPPPVVEIIGDDVLETSQAALTGIAIIGIAPNDVRVPLHLRGETQIRSRDRRGNETGSWETEMVSLSLSGNVSPPGGGTLPVVVRKSAAGPSTGRTSVTDIGGGQFHVDSFFDVFTELSVDGGGSFVESTEAARVELGAPPSLSGLTGPATQRVYFQGGEGSARDNDNNGLDEVDTEIISLDLSGLTPFGPTQWRTDRLRKSNGEMEEQANNVSGTLDVEPFGTGTMDSFFDVWTELSFDGSRHHLPDSVRVEAVVEHKPSLDGEVYRNPGPVREEVTVTGTGAGTGYYVVGQRLQPSPTIEVDVFEETTAFVTLVGGPLGPSPVEAVLRGPATVHVFFEGAEEGDAGDDDGDGLDEVISEMVSMHLTDGNVTLRVRDAAKSPFSPSLGRIDEQANNVPGVLDVDPFAPGDADSFFDVFFEVELADGSVLHNRRPLRMAAEISEKPPSAGCFRGLFPAGPIELYDDDGKPTGIFMTEAKHVTGEVEVDVFEETTLLLDLVGGPAGSGQSLVLRGPATHHVFFEGREGAARDNDGDGLGEVQTELVALDLSGGPYSLNLQSARFSTGEIEERVDNTRSLLDVNPFAPGDADSFFDVFFEIDVGGGLIVHNEQAVRMEAVIDHKPDVACWVFVLPEPVELLDRDGKPSGIFLRSGKHYTGHIEVDDFSLVLAGVDLGFPGGAERIDLRGSARVLVFFEGREGDAGDDDGDGLDEVETEMVSLSLTGTSSFGPLEVRLTPPASRGAIEERVNSNPGILDVPPFSATGLADSFFDIFTEVVTVDEVLHNRLPLRMAGPITRKPAAQGDQLQFGDPVQLFDAQGEASPFSIAGGQLELTGQPTLSVQRNRDGSIKLCWPLPADGFVLQINSDPLNGAGWQDVTEQVVIEGNLKCVTLPDDPDADYRILRLSRP